MKAVGAFCDAFGFRGFGLKDLGLRLRLKISFRWCTLQLRLNPKLQSLHKAATNIEISTRPPIPEPLDKSAPFGRKQPQYLIIWGLGLRV